MHHIWGFLQIRMQHAKTSVISPSTVVHHCDAAECKSRRRRTKMLNIYTSIPECIVFGAFCRYECSSPKQALSVLQPWRTIAMLPSVNQSCRGRTKKLHIYPECIIFGAFCRYKFSRPKQALSVLHFLPLNNRSAPLRCCRV